MLTAALSWRAATNLAPRSTIVFVTAKLPLPMSPKASVTPRSTSAVPTASATFIGSRSVLGGSRSRDNHGTRTAVKEVPRPSQSVTRMHVGVGRAAKALREGSQCIDELRRVHDVEV